MASAMDNDTSDILGGPFPPNVRGSRFGWFSRLSMVFVVPTLLLLYVVVAQIWEYFLIWREKSYRLATRRRHGIPDNDHRPFNVAYAAVVRSRQEEEAGARKTKVERAHVQDQGIAEPDQIVRQRLDSQRNTHTISPIAIPGRFHFSNDNVLLPTSPITNSRSSALTLNFQDRYNPKPVKRHLDSETDIKASKAGLSRRGGRKTLVNDEARKHRSDGNESDRPDHPKKTKLEGEEFIDRDKLSERQEEPKRIHRGSKRVLVDEDDSDDPHQSNKIREKRLRKVSLEKTQQGIVDMDIDEEEDEVPELRPINIRGKKRDRAEAGSTFGGDDDESAPEIEEEDSKARRRRKRRTYVKRKSDTGISSRGKKRDRDIEGDGSDFDSDESSVKISRKKRGKRTTQTPEPSDEDISMDDSQVSSDRVKQRRVGDEWESNGIKYKVGPNGQRLRQTLVKKERQKFPMPKDSQHPDRQANQEVCVEVWLTEEEYREAKGQLRLAWQDSNKPSTEPETPSADTQDSTLPQASTGKDLLWQSTASTVGTSTPKQLTPPSTLQFKQLDRDPRHQSIAANVGLRINPFQTNQAPGKRIASMARVSSVWTGVSVHPGSPASPIMSEITSGSPRGIHLSKWEKQDLEAKAMMKMREASRKKEQEKAQKLKEEQERKEKEAAAVAPKIVPTITLTKPPEDTSVAQAGSKLPAFSFAPPSTTTEPSKAPVSKPLFPSSSSQQLPALSKPSFFSVQPQSSVTPASTAPSAAAAPPKPSGNIFSTNKSESKPTSFGFTAAAPSTSTLSTSTSTNPMFSFGSTLSPPTQTSKPEDKKDGQVSMGASDNPPLFTRFGPQVNTSQPTPPQGGSTASSYNKPVGETSKTPPLFNLSTSQTQTTSTPVPATAGASTSSSGPKFSFGFSSKPATSAPAPAAAPRVLSGAMGNKDAKPAFKPSFSGHRPLAAPTESPNNITNAMGTTAPTFNFSALPSNSPFGGTNAQAQTNNKNSTAASLATDAAPKAMFPGFGAGLSSSSSLTTATTLSNTEPAKQLFSFGPVGTSPSTTAAASSSGPTKPVFSFPSPNVPATNGGPAKSPFVGFGGAPNPISAGSTNGEPTKQGFSGISGTPGSTMPSISAPAKSVFEGFGVTTAAGSSSNELPKSPFGNPPSTSAFSNTSQANSSVFGSSNVFGGGGVANAFGSTSKPPTETAKTSGFSFGTPPNPFPNNVGTVPPKPVFSLGNTTTPSTTPTSAPALGGMSGFGPGDASKNSAIPQASPAGGFTFGATGNAFGASGKTPALGGKQQ